MRGRVLVLAYHNVIPDDVPTEGDASLHLRWSSFRQQLDCVERFCEVIPISQLLTPRNDDALPAVVITFDDAYRGALALAIPELRRRQMAATLFVAPGILGRFGWWDRWADTSGVAWDPSLREHLLVELSGDEGRIEKWAGMKGLSAQSLGQWHQIASSDELCRSVNGDGGCVQVGCHTWTHRNLATLSAERITREITQTMSWLSQRFSSTVPWLAYPYGRWSDVASKAAREAGLVGALTVAGGWLRAIDQPFTVNRWNVAAGLSLNGFRLGASGLPLR